MTVNLLLALVALESAVRQPPIRSSDIETVRSLSVPTSDRIVGSCERNLVYGATDRQAWSFDGARVCNIRKPAGLVLFGVARDGQAVYARAGAEEDAQGRVYHDGGVELRCLQDGAWVWLVLPNLLHLSGKVNCATATTNVNVAGSVAAKPASGEAVVCLHLPHGDRLQTVRLGVKPGSFQTRTVKVRVAGIREPRVFGDIVATNDGVWFTLPAEQFTPRVLQGLRDVDCGTWPTRHRDVLVRADDLTGVARPELIITFGYGAQTEAVKDGRARPPGRIAPFGPDAIVILQTESTLLLVQCAQPTRVRRP
jgi:hypothetical protein